MKIPPPDDPPSTSCRQTCGELRCDCGNLLARWTSQGLELKCRRCKRIIPVDFETPPERPRPPP